MVPKGPHRQPSRKGETGANSVLPLLKAQYAVSKVLAAADWNLKSLLGTVADQAMVACVMIPAYVNWLGPESVDAVGPLLPVQRISNDAIA